MKIILHCPICGVFESYHDDWTDLNEFFMASPYDEPEFRHDETDNDCGGSLTYTEATQ